MIKRQWDLKSALIWSYILIALVTGLILHFAGENRHRSLIHNLGAGSLWPMTIMKTYPQIDASSPEQFDLSFDLVEGSHPGDIKGHRLFSEALGLASYYIYIQQQTDAELKALSDFSHLDLGSNTLFRKLFKQPDIRMQVAKQFDGMTFGDIVAQRDSIKESVQQALAKR
ncbi:hypothetical protein [Oceanospirillum sediminis]|uniref:Uncharacterized protein n=1 Tax=Oceanospirillum sediminis TaxID=2760088 RepID=A0A839IUH3_9GAMM|nr:hypothetical protein [Oceanospirillum sediminis]MBB1489005.1 hypothetical protein [Oceanospirillum sediminis]